MVKLTEVVISSQTVQLLYVIIADGVIGSVVRESMQIEQYCLC